MGPVSLTVLLEPSSEDEVTVRVATGGGAAVAGADFTPVNRVLVFAPGETSQAVTVEIIDDTTYENAESFVLELSSPTGYAALAEPSAATVEISGNDSPPIVFLHHGLEGDSRYGASEAVGEIVIPVRLSEPSGIVATVRFDTSDDEAVGGEDYDAISTTLVFGPGEVEKLVTILIDADGIPEGIEDFDIDLSDPVGCGFGPAGPSDGKVDVFDSRALAFAVDSISVPEDAGSVELTVMISEVSDGRVEFDWHTRAGSATANDDYQELIESAKIYAGESETTISIPLIEDDLAEADETFTVSFFFSGEAAVGEPSEVVVTITDNDGPAILFDGSIFAVGEEDGVATVTVVLNEVQDHEVSVDWTAADGTAKLGDDYTGTAGTIIVPTGETSAEIEIEIAEDLIVEADETIQLSLSSATGIALGEPSTATLTILDNDRIPVVSFAADALSVFETDDAVTLLVVLNRPADVPVEVQIDTADGTATSGADYTTVSGTVTIPTGESAATVTVSLIADGLLEGDETFSVSLSVLDGADLWQPSTATVTIIDDASLPRISLATAAVSLTEWEGPVVLDVILDRVPVYEVTVRVATVDGEAVAGADFWPVDQVLTFAPGVTSQPVIIDINDDPSPEPDESFSVSLSAPSAAVLAEPSVATVTILSGGDWPPFVYLADGGSYTAAYTAFEQNRQIAIPVRLSYASGYETRVDFATGGGSAVAGEDYEAVSETLVFQPGEIEKLIVIPVSEDGTADSGETFQIALTNPAGCTLDFLLPDDGVVTIRDDVWVSFTEGEVSVLEDEAAVTLAVTLSAALDQAVYIWYSTEDGTATAGKDYTAVSNPLYFAPGATTRYFSVSLIADTEGEGDETFSVTLGDTSGVPLGNPSIVQVTIFDDDLPEVAVAQTARTVGEDDGEVSVGVTLSFAVAWDVSVDYVTADATATDALDYTGDAGPLVIPVGEMSGVIPISILDDDLIEGEERFTLTISNPQGAALRSDDTTTVTIIDDELLPVISLPRAGRYFGDGDHLAMDATASAVPAGYETWFAALRDAGEGPMDLVYSALGLTGGFESSDLDDRYLVRLVLTAEGSMPADEILRGRLSPCAGVAAPCSSAEVVVSRALMGQPTGFRAAHAFPEQIMLVWDNTSTLTLERSDDGGETWLDLGLTETERYFQDNDLVEGTTYHYRGRSHVSHPWSYLGDTTTPPGMPVEVPVWAAPRVVPQLDGVTWNCPPGAAQVLCDGTLHARLQSEPGTGSLSGATIRVFLNEETFELTDGAGEEIHTEFNVSDDNYLLAFRGYDLPACVVRRTEPDLEIVVPDGQDEIAVDLPGVVFGGNGLRFEVETAAGDISERAMLVLVLNQPVQNDSQVGYPRFLPLLFGDVMTTNDPLIRGDAAAGRHSPDCVDGDSWYYYDHSARGYNSALFFDRVDFTAEDPRLIWSDGTGSWSASYSGVPDGVYQLQTIPPAGWPDWGMVGREISRPSGGFFTADYATEVSTDNYSARVDITINSTVTDLSPHLSFVRDSVLLDSADEAAPGIVRFRITDADQNLDMSTVRLFNCSLETCDPGQPGLTRYPGFYASDQSDSEGDYGWFVAQTPLLRGDNQLHLCAADADGNPLGTPTDPCIPTTVTRTSPLVFAVVTEPSESPVTAPPGAIIPLDGSDSAMPEGGVALWTVGRESAYLGNPWQQVGAMAPTGDLEDLRTSTLMPYDPSYRLSARLVVAASPDDLPAELWPEDGSLPCVRAQGDGLCDSADVSLVAACSYDPDNAQVVIDQPAHPPNVGLNDPIHLAAHVAIPNLEPFAFRWLIYRKTGNGQSWLVTTIGADDDGEGFSTTNNDLTITPAGIGLDRGHYTLYAEARYPASGCPGTPWYSGWSGGIGLTVGHSCDGVAPGRVVEGDTFRVYSSSLAEHLVPGELATVLIDDDSDPYDDELLEYQLAIADGGYFEVVADPQFLPANGGTSYWVWVAEDADLTGLSSEVELRVEPGGTAESPNIVADDEGTSCGEGGALVNGECAHPILPGQTWSGEWGEPGDTDYFTFMAGAGTEVRITLDRADTSRPPQHSEAPMPEILMARADGLVFAVSDPVPPGTLGTSVDTTLSMDGRYFVIARTPVGSGSYLVSLEKLSEGGTGAPTFGYTKSRVYLATSSKPAAWFRAPVLDGFGNPISGAPVQWHEGADCGDGRFCGNGVIDHEQSSVDGLVVHFSTTEPGAVQLW